MRELEGAQALPEAEEAIDDPLRMARCPLAGKAVAGIVTAVDREHREVVTKEGHWSFVTVQVPAGTTAFITLPGEHHATLSGGADGTEHTFVN